MPPVPAPPKVPTGAPIGAPVDFLPAMIPGVQTPGWGYFTQDGEHVPEWLWPDYTRLVERILAAAARI
jgi:hypothetical protein